ncbi:hypothetical protein [Natrarchaeobius chitinivorans]|uniref:Uncharacterized protein n=1 Tax=Natrarchaeobius chitinivorans TaxID=1679083 RepID=A0A3N6MAY6_NATCH|nr:hypothetical protein [Natrarchaeobius chitinivorans]RQG97824.1 hypothetical protein EA473_01055 [Natrarchaeobius chitinivorans]
MTDRPPSPPSVSPVIPTEPTDDDRVVATTEQLTTSLERALDCRLADDELEELLVELDRRGYVEWVTVTRTGEYVWDLTESPERIADAIAEAAVERLASWLEASPDDGSRASHERSSR